MESKISRRTVLRGLGTAMALPLLDVMMPTSALAQTPKAKPVRLAWLFVPNGMNMKQWRSEGEGANFALPELLSPLSGVKDYLTMMTGLAQSNAAALGDGGGDHARSAAAFLTGVHPRKTAGADIKGGISADQIAAQVLSGQTRFPSLEIGIERGAQAGNCDSGYSCAYSSSISWRGPSTPVAKEVDPRLVFERLFSTGDPNETAEARSKRLEYNASILDFVMEDANALKKQLGAHDRAKLEEYFAGVREIEQRLSWIEKANKEGGVLKDNNVTVPTGIPGEMGEHIRLMGDMMILAFQADITRVCTFMFANEGSNRPYKMIGIGEGHHEISHHGKAPDKLEKLKQINHYHIQQLGYILGKMKATKDGDGNLLDNTMLVYGGGISDPDRHNHDDLPILVAGKGGGALAGGRHLVYNNPTPLNNLYLSMLDRVGVRVDKYGDASGHLQPLL